MPAEMFHDQVGPFDLRIAWGQADCVQVATQHRDGFRAMVKIVSDWLVAAGENPIDAEWLKKAVEEKTLETPAFSGWHFTFTENDRRALNRLVEALRKGRNQAFGADA